MNLDLFQLGRIRPISGDELYRLDLARTPCRRAFSKDDRTRSFSARVDHPGHHISKAARKVVVGIGLTRGHIRSRHDLQDGYMGYVRLPWGPRNLRLVFSSASISLPSAIWRQPAIRE